MFATQLSDLHSGRMMGTGLRSELAPGVESLLLVRASEPQPLASGPISSPVLPDVVVRGVRQDLDSPKESKCLGEVD